ncbi:MAG: Uma2 family endonuclease [Deltaproteobacteria bacterium]|nr:Uma2 family endonuclease [Deltaproteobacteria bacterium]
MAHSSVLEKIEEMPLSAVAGQYTAKDYFNLPEGSPYQLIEGELIMTPSPLTEHQIISKNLELAIYLHIKKNNLGLALNAPIDVYLNNKNAYQPDIIFISNKNKDIIRKHGIDGAPDLVIEILSPSNSYYDVRVKKDIYERSGVIEYIIVDPRTKSIDVYRRTVERPETDLNTYYSNVNSNNNSADTPNLNEALASNLNNNEYIQTGFNETMSVRLENNGKLYIKTLDLEIELKDIFTEI